MNIFFEQFKNQQSSDNNCFQQPKQNNWWEQFQKENEINKNEVRADGKQTHKWDIDKPNTNFTKTTYGRKDEGFHTLANGVPYNDKNVKLNGNNYQYYDHETNQYHDIYALGMNQLKEYSNHKNKNLGVWDNSIYGSLIDVKHEDGNITSGIIMDCSLAGNKSAIIDQWCETVNPHNENVEFSFKRIGWGTTKNPKR